MFQEKISLKLSEHLVDLIDHDCLQFGILKQDRSPNRNAFLNRLFLSFQAWGDKTSEYSFAFSKIINDDEAQVSVGFKPTRETSLLVQKIKEEQDNFSFYRKKLLMIYDNFAQDKRESFLFYDIYKEAKKAIQNQCCLLCQLNNNKQETVLLEPHFIASSSPERRTYLLGLKNGQYCTIGISKIRKAVMTKQKSSELSKAQEIRLLRAVKYGPQYKYSEDDEEIVVRLDSFGLEYYKKRYVYRPVPDKTDGNIMTFHCSPDQFFNYFIRLGNAITILKPESRKNRFKSFYQKSLNRLS